MTNRAGSVSREDAQDKGATHIPGGTEQDGVRLHHNTKNGMQFKTYGFFISGIFHLIFSDHSLPWVPETIEPLDEGN